MFTNTFPRIFKMMTSHLKTLKNQLILLIVVYFFLRLLFLFFNFHQYSSFPLNQLFLSFLHGLRFDLAALFLLNSPLILLSFVLPNKNRWAHYLTHGLFLILNLPFIFANLIDLEYFKYTGKRMGLDIFIIKNEAMNQFDQFLKNYWELVCLAFCLALVLHVLGQKKKGSDLSGPHHRPHVSALLSLLTQRFLLGLIVISLSVVLIRGGFQKKVLKPINAFTIGHFNLGHLSLNSTFTLLWSRNNRGFSKKATYFKTEEEALQLLARPLSKKGGSSEACLPHVTEGDNETDNCHGNTKEVIHRRKGEIRDNVVLIILESFATEFWGAANDYPGYTPFLDSLTQKGLFFKKNFSNSRMSLNAFFSILFGIPPLLDTPLAKSNYQQNRWIGLGEVLSAAGYHTSFFHGAPKGTMYFDSISTMAKLKDYYPMERYPHKEAHFDGAWGIYDRPFLEFAAKKMALHPRPFFSTLFTLSTHQPYHLPPGDKNRFPKGSLEIHETIGYTDHALESFFKTAKKMPWFKDTLFIITADHTQFGNTQFYNTPLGRFMVPLLIYHPGKTLPPARIDQVTHHADIFPTIVDYLGLTQNEYLLFGRSIFDNTPEGLALLYLEGHYWLVQNNYFLQYNPYQKKALLFNYSDHGQKNPLKNPQMKSKMLNKLKAYIQYFQNGLIENNLYLWSK